MSEPFLERLSRFTPDAGGLDRDALLFAAGRSSARPNRGWKFLSAALAGTQLLVVALLLPRSVSVAPTVNGSIAESSLPHPSANDAAPPAPIDSRIWSVRHDLDETPLDDRGGDSVVLVEGEPALHAFGLPASSTIN
jgi:hypothetical protein